jgi:DNA-binding HxlR family transcriptional regulator
MKNSVVRSGASQDQHRGENDQCQAMQAILDIVGRRWTGAVLVASAGGRHRFGELRQSISGISDRLLAQRLKELEGLGLVKREVVATTPVQILYSVTASGDELIASLQPLLRWGLRHLT